MYHKIDANSLCAGMYTINTGVSWLQHPYLYTQEGELTQADISRLTNDGFTEAYIDLSRCRPGTLPPELERLVPSVTADDDVPQFLPPPPKVTIAEEMPKARMVFRSSLNMAKDMLDGVRRGSFDLPSAEPVVENILNSLDRNAEALLSLCKLRQTDDYTYTHCVNASVMSTIFARGLGLSADSLHSIGMGGLFHDIGKTMLPQQILNAPRRLNDKEMEIMRRHPQLGLDYLVDHNILDQDVLHIVIQHHEQYCGQGYPNKLPGDNISLPGRIAAVVDVFDALSSRRVYKEPMPLSKALSILYSMRGKEFFPGMVERFIRLLGVYPVGSAVELEDGSHAVVSAANMTAPLKPTVILVRDKDGKSLDKKECALADSASPAIVRSITADELGEDPADVLGIPH